MKYPPVFIAFILFTIWPLCSLGAAPAGECLNAGCHAKMLEAKYVHGPVAVGECGYCHTQTGKHSFRLSDNGAGLCGSCHDIKIKSNCVSCHDPHGSAREFQLKPGVNGKCKKE